MLHSSRGAAHVLAALLLFALQPAAVAAEQPADDAEQNDRDDSSGGAPTWGVAPSSAEGDRSAFEYTLDPGETISDSVTVSNHSAEELTLAVYAHDAFTTEDGGFDLLAADAEAVDVGSWVAVSEPTVTVPARSQIDVEFELAVPDNATPGDHAGGVVASLASGAENDEGDRVLVEHRVGARIYLRVSGELEPAFTIEQLDARYESTINPFGTGSVTATYTLRNTGNVRLTGLPQAEIAGPFGLGRRSADGEPLSEILPGDSYEAILEVDRAAPLFRLGTTVEVEPVGVAGDQFDAPYVPATREVGVWAVPWATILLVLLVAGSIITVLLRRRRNAKRLAAKLSAARAEGAAQARSERAVASHATSGEET